MDHSAASPAPMLADSLSYELSESQTEQSQLVELSYPALLPWNQARSRRNLQRFIDTVLGEWFSLS